MTYPLSDGWEPHPLREAALDSLVEDAVKELPLWVRNHFIFRGDDPAAAAREYYQYDDDAVDERILEMEQAEADQ